MSKTVANIDNLRKLGQNIQQDGGAYQTEVKKIYTTIDNLGTQWKGADNQAYINKVNEHKQVISDLGVLIDNYGRFLIETANNIQRIQDDIASSAGRL